jgi:putative transposase
MPRNLHGYDGSGYLHFITTSCYPRRPLLGTPQSRHLCLEVMEQTGKRHHSVVVGYVVMPEHVHLLFREPERGKPSLVLLRSKQTFARRLPQNLRGRINSKIRKTARSGARPSPAGPPTL